MVVCEIYRKLDIKILNFLLSSSYRLILPMQIVCRSVRKAGYVSANISLLGTGGTVRTARCNFLLIKVLEVVRYVHKCELFIYKH